MVPDESETGKGIFTQELKEFSLRLGVKADTLTPTQHSELTPLTPSNSNS